jgi:acid stress-induced BolA-like protein IbaG/YrbA
MQERAIKKKRVLKEDTKDQIDSNNPVDQRELKEVMIEMKDTVIRQEVNLGKDHTIEEIVVVEDFKREEKIKEDLMIIDPLNRHLTNHY